MSNDDIKTKNHPVVLYMYSLDLPQFSIHSWGSAIHPGLGNKFRRCKRFRSIFFLDQYDMLNENCRLVSELPTAFRDGDVTLKGSQRMGDGLLFIKIAAPLSLSKDSSCTFKIKLSYLVTGEWIKKGLYKCTVYKSELETWYAKTMLFIKILYKSVQLNDFVNNKNQKERAF